MGDGLHFEGGARPRTARKEERDHLDAYEVNDDLYLLGVVSEEAKTPTMRADPLQVVGGKGHAQVVPLKKCQGNVHVVDERNLRVGRIAVAWRGLIVDDSQRGGNLGP